MLDRGPASAKHQSRSLAEVEHRIGDVQFVSILVPFAPDERKTRVFLRSIL
jgi:hypothetical protein